MVYQFTDNISLFAQSQALSALMFLCSANVWEFVTLQQWRKGKSKWRPDVGNIVASHKSQVQADVVSAVVVNRNRITCQLPYTKLKERLRQVRPGNGACPFDSI